MNELTIIVTGKARTGKSTLARFLQALLQLHMSKPVPINDTDLPLLGVERLDSERIRSVIEHAEITIEVRQLPREPLVEPEGFPNVRWPEDEEHLDQLALACQEIMDSIGWCPRCNKREHSLDCTVVRVLGDEALPQEGTDGR